MSSTHLAGDFAKGTIGWRLVRLRSIHRRALDIEQLPWRFRACLAVAQAAAAGPTIADDAPGIPNPLRIITELLATSPAPVSAREAIRCVANRRALAELGPLVRHLWWRALAWRGGWGTRHGLLAVVHAHGRAGADALAHAAGGYVRHLTERGVVTTEGVARFLGPVDRAAEMRPSLALHVALCVAGRTGTAEALLPRLNGRDRAAGLVWLACAEHAAGASRRAHRKIAALERLGVVPQWVDFALQRLVQIELSRGRVDDAMHFVQRMSTEPRRDEGHVLVAKHHLAVGDFEAARRVIQRCRRTTNVVAVGLVRAELALRQLDFDEAATRLRRLREPIATRRRGAFDAVSPPLEHGDPQTWLTSLVVGLALASDGTHDIVRNRDAATLLASEACLREAAGLAPDRLEARVGALGGIAARVAGDGLRAHRVVQECAALRRVVTRDEPITPLECAFIQGVRGADHEAVAHPATSALRAFHDEGIALSGKGQRRRRALFRAARWSLRRASERRDPHDAVWVASRLRSAVHLGGPPARKLFREVGPCLRGGRFAALALHAWIDVSAADALGALCGDWKAWAADTDNGLVAVRRLEARGEVAFGFARHLEALLRGLDALGVNAGMWWHGFARAWFEVYGRAVPVACVELLVRERKRIASESPEMSFARIDGDLRWQLDDHYPRLPGRLVTDEALLAVARDNDCAVRGFSKPWLLERWQSVLREVDADTVVVSRGMVTRFAHRIRGGRAMADALLMGRPPRAPLATPLGLGGGYALRFLDKRKDIFAYLRFADAAPCCFHSNSAYYPAMARWVFRIWRDPLSYCFLIEKRRRAIGFVFGAFGWWKSTPVALLNGIYLREQRSEVRTAVLRTIEERFCIPLGIRAMGVANQNGGDGSIAKGYRRETRMIHRLRALRTAHGAPMTEIYDDLSDEVNRPVDMTLYFKDLAPRRRVDNGVGTVC